MNEPANFGTNEEKPFNWPEKDRPYWSLKCPYNTLDDPPYRTSKGHTCIPYIHTFPTPPTGREGSVLFNDILYTFYLLLYGVR